MEGAIVILVVALIFLGMWWMTRNLPQGLNDPVTDIEHKLRVQACINETNF